MIFSPTTLVLLLSSHATALIHGVDSATLVPLGTFKKALSEGFVKAIPRGYEEACGIGGQVDPNFVTTYRNAVAAGYKNIDTYWYPCTGKINKCKPYDQQISELGTVIENNKIQIGRIWIDFETDRVCNPWDYGASGNLAEAKKLIAAARQSGYALGIYSSPGEWSAIFGSRDVVLANDLPLWFATYDNIQNLDFNSKFGGWTSAEGKQYTDKSESKKFDLNVFDS